MSKSKVHNKKRIRYSERVFYITMAVIVLFVLAFCVYRETTKTSTTTVTRSVYNYLSQSDVKYNVNLIPNDFIDRNSLGVENVFVTDMINDVDFNVNFKYKGSQKSKVHYKYNVTANINSTSELDGKKYKIWDKQIVVVNNKEGDFEGETSIDENFKIDLKSYNELAKLFRENYLDAVDSNLVISFNMETETTVNDKVEKNTYNHFININLDEVLTKINLEKHQEVNKDIQLEKKVSGITNQKMLILYFVLIIIDLVGVFYVIFNTRITHSIRNEYKLELNAILKGCSEKIVRVNDKIDTEKTNEVTVKDFGELLKLSEELMEPILYWNDDEENEAWFYIIKNKVTYKYVLVKF